MKFQTYFHKYSCRALGFIFYLTNWYLCIQCCVNMNCEHSKYTASSTIVQVFEFHKNRLLNKLNLPSQHILKWPTSLIICD